MEGISGMNDMSRVVEADRAHVWHHLSQHKQYETVDPRVIVEGKGMRVWDARARNISTPSRAGSGQSTSATGGNPSPTPSVTS